MQRLWSNHPRFVVIVLAVGCLCLGYGLRGGPKPQTAVNVNLKGEEHADVAQKDQMKYVCPMMCVPPREKAGKCPVCGMDLVPFSTGVVTEAEGSGSPRLKLSPEAIKLAQVEVAPVERKAVAAEVRAFGRVEYDPAHTSVVTAFMPSVIDRVYVKRTGVFVRYGDPLFDLYSSDLYFTQQELLEAMQYVPSFLAFQADRPYVGKKAKTLSRKPTADGEEISEEAKEALQKITAIRYKLLQLGMHKRDIDELMQRNEAPGIATVYSPINGFLIAQNAFEGSYVNTGTAIFTIADPRFIWVSLDVYESDYPWIRRGQEVVFQTDAYPGETFAGKVADIGQVFNPETRTFKVGVIFPDEGGRFKPAMFARAVIQAGLTADGSVVSEVAEGTRLPLTVPASAPLVTGKRAIVYVQIAGEEGVYEGREVALGPKAGDYYVVREGLKEGEMVVVNGNFKIDSAVQILAKGSMMDKERYGSLPGQHLSAGSQEMADDYLIRRGESRSRESPDHRHTDQVMKQEEEWRGLEPDEGYGEKDTIRRRRPGAYGERSIPASPPRLEP